MTNDLILVKSLNDLLQLYIHFIDQHFCTNTTSTLTNYNIWSGVGEDHESVMKKVDEINKALKQAKIRVKVDDRLNICSGKFLIVH